MKSLDNRINSKSCLSIPPTRHKLKSLATGGKDTCLRQSVSGSAVVNETVRNGSIEIRSLEVIKKKMQVASRRGCGYGPSGSVIHGWKDMVENESMLERRGGDLQHRMLDRRE